jgi:hypothetical protein
LETEPDRDFGALPGQKEKVIRTVENALLQSEAENWVDQSISKGILKLEKCEEKEQFHAQPKLDQDRLTAQFNADYWNEVDQEIIKKLKPSPEDI